MIYSVNAITMTKNPSHISDKASSHSKARAEKTSIDKDQTAVDSHQLIAELREAVRARDDFLAVAAHELRNPPTPILLSVQLLRIAERSGNHAQWGAEIDR